MPLFALGLNYQTAPLAIRERVAFEPARIVQALSQLRRAQPVNEAAILSTCNRTELYFQGESPEPAANWLAGFHQLPTHDLKPYLYTLPHQEAVRHVFRVTSGLDSMVLGEPQILGQVKEAARQAEVAGTLGTTLHKLFQHSFAVAKEVRSTTAIGANIVSMAAAAVHLTERIFERMADQRVLFIGAGEMVSLCAAHFAGAQPKQITIANRTPSRASALAQRFNGDVLRLEEVGDALPHYDVVVSCTGSPLPIIGLGMVERAIKLRRHRPIVMVDLAVPRDIESQISRLDDIFLYTVDDLAQIVSSGMESRQQAVEEAEHIINHRVDGFLHWMQTRSAVPTIRALREHTEALRLKELERARHRLTKGESVEQVLEALSVGLSNKLLHAPLHYLNQAEGESLTQASDLIQHLYGVPPSSTPPLPER